MATKYISMAIPYYYIPYEYLVTPYKYPLYSILTLNISFYMFPHLRLEVPVYHRVDPMPAVDPFIFICILSSF